MECDPSKIEAVKNWPTPTNVKEVRAFVGFSSYYRKFIRGYASMCSPLHDLTKKNVKFVWNEHCENAFKMLKEKLCEAPVLSYVNTKDVFVLDTDASLKGVSGVLSQIQNGEEKVISYGSKVLSKTQQNYCTTMRELLAVVVFIKQFHHYLWGRKFLLRTDHASLRWLVNFKEPEGMLARWLSVLSSYDFDTQHRKGILHGNADGLSRQPARKCKRVDCTECALPKVDCVCAITRSQVTAREVQNSEPGCSNWTGTSSVNNQDKFIGNSIVQDLDQENLSKTDLNEQVSDANLSISGIDINLGNSDLRTSGQKDSNWLDIWSRDQLREAQLNDSNLSQVIKLLNDNDGKPNKEILKAFPMDVRIICGQWDYLQIHDNILYRKWVPVNPRESEIFQFVVPESLRNDILKYLHDHKTSAHMGVTKTLKKVRTKFYWPGHKNDITRWIQKCKICHSYKSGHKPKKAPLVQDFVSAPLCKIAIDIVGKLPETEKSNCYILVITDYYSRFVEAYPMKDQTAQTVADIVATEWICRYGVPNQILTDQGRQFESDLFQNLCSLLDIKKLRTARYRPNSDGLVERFNRSLRSMLRALCNDVQSDWDEHLCYVLMAYRATVQESTKCTPNLLMFGHELNISPVDIVYGNTNEKACPNCPIQYVQWVREAMSNAFEKVKYFTKQSAIRQKRSYDKNSRLRQFKRNDWVWVYSPPTDREKFGKGWKGPYLVINVLGEVNYVVQEGPGKRLLTLHVYHMKLYELEDTPINWSQNLNKYQEVGVQVNL